MSKEVRPQFACSGQVVLICRFPKQKAGTYKSWRPSRRLRMVEHIRGHCINQTKRIDHPLLRNGTNLPQELSRNGNKWHKHPNAVQIPSSPSKAMGPSFLELCSSGFAKSLLGAPGIATRSKNATFGALGRTTRSEKGRYVWGSLTDLPRYALPLAQARNENHVLDQDKAHRA